MYYKQQPNLNLHDYSLLLATADVNPRYQLYFFPPNLKHEVERMLKSGVKKHSCCETGQSGNFPLVP